MGNCGTEPTRPLRSLNKHTCEDLRFHPENGSVLVQFYGSDRRYTTLSPLCLKLCPLDDGIPFPMWGISGS